MANVTIGDLTVASSVDGTELLEIEQSGTSKQVTAALIAALGGGGGGGTGNDVNNNYTANNFNSSFRTQATTGLTVTLTVASAYQQYFTGTSTAIVKLPVASTLTVGHRFFIANASTGSITIQSSGLSTVATVATDESAMVTCILASGTGATSWSVVSAGAGGGTSVDDTPYDATTWNADTTHAPSKNAVRDKIEAIVLGGGAGDALTTNPLSQFAATTSLQLKNVMSDETGSGALVFATSPTLVTPVLGTPVSGTLSGCTVDGTNLLGYRGIPQNSQTTAYTTVLTDAGKCIFHPASDNNARTFTIDSNANVAYPTGTVIEFINMAATSSTIAITSDTMTLLPAGTTGSRTLAQYGRANAEKISATAWVISGNSALT